LNHCGFYGGKGAFIGLGAHGAKCFDCAFVGENTIYTAGAGRIDFTRCWFSDPWPTDGNIAVQG
jgi:hypothetical protein